VSADRAQFHADRLTGLGGSDAAAALGVSPWKTALELYLEKRGELAPFEGNEATRWGMLLEPVVRQEYAERTGRIVRVPEGVLRAAGNRDFMLAHPDGITDDGRLYEGKTARSPEGWGEPGTDQVPQGYLLQVQHYMLVTAMPVADIAVLIGGSDFRMYEIPADRELQEMIADGEHDFWMRVQKGEPPEPDFEAPTARELVRRMYPGTNAERIAATPAHMHWRQVYEEAQRKAGEYEKAAEIAKTHLLYEMKEAAALAFPDGKVLRRKLAMKKGYTVEPSQYIDARFVNDKEK